MKLGGLLGAEFTCEIDRFRDDDLGWRSRLVHFVPGQPEQIAIDDWLTMKWPLGVSGVKSVSAASR